MSEKSRPLSIRAAAAVATATIALSGAGCTIDGSRIQSDRETVNPQLVVIPDGVAKSPTDTVANDISQINYLWSSLKRRPKDAKSIDEANTKGLVGAAELSTLAQVWALDSSGELIVPEYFNSKVADVDMSKIDASLTTIKDPAVRDVVRKKIQTELIYTVLFDVISDSIEVRDGEKVIRSIRPSLAKKLRHTLEVLDAASSVIQNYDDPRSINDDAADITDPKLRRDLKVYAKGSPPWMYGTAERHASDEAYDRILQEKDKIDKTVVNPSEKAAYEAYSAYWAMYQGQSVAKVIRNEIQDHNNVIAVDKLSAFPVLEQPGREIDLSAVDGPKAYRTSSEQSTYEREFGELRAENGAITLDFHEGNNLPDAAREQLQRLTDDVMPLLGAAFKNGDLISIRFIIADDFNPYFDPSTHEIHMVLPRDGSTSEEQFRQALSHETIHALVGSVYDQQTSVNDNEVTLLRNACTALSKQSYEVFEKSMRDYPEIVHNLITTAQTAGDKKIFKNLGKIIKDRKIFSIVNEAVASDNPYFKKDAGITNCAADTVNFRTIIAKAVGNSLGTYDSQEISANVDDLLDRYYDPTNKVIDSNFDKLITAWSDSQHKYSLWSRLNEAAYVDTKYVFKEYIGHSADNSTEMMATVGDVTLNNSQEVASMIEGLNLKDRRTVVGAINATYRIVANRHPSLKAFLNELLTHFKKI